MAEHYGVINIPRRGGEGGGVVGKKTMRHVNYRVFGSELLKQAV